MSNPYANKAFLNATMSTLLSYSFSQVAVSTTATSQAGNQLTVADATNIVIGSFLSITGYSSVGVLAVSSNVLTVDISQSFTGSIAVSASAYTTTVQNALNLFVTTVTAQNYYKFAAACTAAMNASNTLLSLSNKSNAINSLACIDDGSVVFDSTKATQSSAGLITNLVSSNRGNTFANFSKKISLLVGAYTSGNNGVLTDASGNSVAYVIGTAGGNNINENHHSRPEILTSLLKDSGIGFSKRFSTSSNADLYYMSQRVGISLEENQGTFRISIPTVNV